MSAKNVHAPVELSWYTVNLVRIRRSTPKSTPLVREKVCGGYHAGPWREVRIFGKEGLTDFEFVHRSARNQTLQNGRPNL